MLSICLITGQFLEIYIPFAWPPVRRGSYCATIWRWSSQPEPIRRKKWQNAYNLVFVNSQIQLFNKSFVAVTRVHHWWLDLHFIRKDRNGGSLYPVFLVFSPCTILHENMGGKKMGGCCISVSPFDSRPFFSPLSWKQATTKKSMVIYCDSVMFLWLKKWKISLLVFLKNT